MTSVETRIRDAASRNTQLLATLRETDHAPPDLAAQTRYIADLQAQINNAAKQIKQIEAKRQKEFKEHESYRDSVMKRFAYKATGKKEKFEQRAKKEEQEYFEALQTEHREKEIKKNLDARIAEAQQALPELQNAASRHQQAQQELDSLYDGIFSGPTPGFPEEDQLEQDKNQAIARYQEMQGHLGSENQVINLLGQAQNLMRNAINSTEEALSCSRGDMFGGGAIMDMMERQALQQSENYVTQAQNTVAHAHNISPNVGGLPPVRIAQGSLMSDVFFDNIFTDMAFHDKIKQSMVEIKHCAAVVDAEMQRARARAGELSQRLNERQAALNEARSKLQKAREVAFERILSGGGPAAPSASADAGQANSDTSVPPPAYQP